jgi:hypothetical protein
VTCHSRIFLSHAHAQTERASSHKVNVLAVVRTNSNLDIGENTWVYPDWIHNEIYAHNNKHTLRSNTKGYGGKTHETDSQNSDITAPSARDLYHLQFSLQAASPETFGYTLVWRDVELDNGAQYNGVTGSERTTGYRQ